MLSPDRVIFLWSLNSYVNTSSISLSCLQIVCNVWILRLMLMSCGALLHGYVCAEHPQTGMKKLVAEAEASYEVFCAGVYQRDLKRHQKDFACELLTRFRHEVVMSSREDVAKKYSLDDEDMELFTRATLPDMDVVMAIEDGPVETPDSSVHSPQSGGSGPVENPDSSVHKRKHRRGSRSLKWQEKNAARSEERRQSHFAKLFYTCYAWQRIILKLGCMVLSNCDDEFDNHELVTMQQIEEEKWTPMVSVPPIMNADVLVYETVLPWRVVPEVSYLPKSWRSFSSQCVLNIQD